MITTVEESVFGELIATIPDEIIEAFKLKTGDTVNFEEKDGAIHLTFPKKEKIEIDLPDEEIFALMKLAHEEGITFNQLVEDSLRKEISKIQKDISVATLEENFEYIMEDVRRGTIYYIFEDQNLTKGLCVMIPYHYYEGMQSCLKE